MKSLELNKIEFFVLFFHQVPRVFIGGKFIGGGNETAELHRKKKLGKMLQKIGAIL
jgi:glutaredoxin